MYNKKGQLFSNVLNISKIKYYSEQKNISLRSIARQLDMTATGFNNAVKNESLRAKVLNDVLQILDINYYDLVENTDNTVRDVPLTMISIEGNDYTLSDLFEKRQKIQTEIDKLLSSALG